MQLSIFSYSWNFICKCLSILPSMEKTLVLLIYSPPNICISKHIAVTQKRTDCLIQSETSSWQEVRPWEHHYIVPLVTAAHLPHQGRSFNRTEVTSTLQHVIRFVMWGSSTASHFPIWTRGLYLKGIQFSNSLRQTMPEALTTACGLDAPSDMS